MADTYEIKYEQMPVGTAQVEKQGLYYCFSCRCNLPQEGMYRIFVSSGTGREDLGICIPKDGGFGMDKKIPTKRLADGPLAFTLHPKDGPTQIQEKPEETPVQTAEPEYEPMRFVPVTEEEPFEHLDELEHAVLTEEGDQLGILIPNTEVTETEDEETAPQ